jgi:predicted Zn-dependent protease
MLLPPPPCRSDKAESVTGFAFRRANLFGCTKFGYAKFGYASLVVACLLSISACSQRPQTSLPAIPAGAPYSTVSPFLSERDKLLLAFGGVYQNRAIENQLNTILARLAARNPELGSNLRVTILNSPTPNAFALETSSLTPDGSEIFISRGLLALSNDPAEIAAVMAHELAHGQLRHQQQRELAARQVSQQIKEMEPLLQSEALERIEARGRMTLAGFSRAQETEADLLGARLMAQAGYDPFAAAPLLKTLGRESALRGRFFAESSGQKNHFLASHPATPERIARIVAESKTLHAPPTLEPERESWLQALDGMIYGDDAAQGLVRGRHFTHPALNIGFSAPETFVLDNSAQALVGVLPGKPVALRFDRIARTGQTATEALQAGWIDKTSLGVIEAIHVNGLEGATAIASGEDWRFRLAAIVKDDTIYRFIFAAHPLTGDLDGLFRQSIASFHVLKPEESQQARPMRLKTVQARAGDSVESLAARSVLSDHAVERLSLLNGLERGSLQIGRFYKIISE